MFGPGPFPERLAAAQAGDKVEVALLLSAPSALAVWVFAAVALTAALMLLAALRLPRGGVDSTAYATAAPTR